MAARKPTAAEAAAAEAAAAEAAAITAEAAEAAEAAPFDLVQVRTVDGSVRWVRAVPED